MCLNRHFQTFERFSYKEAVHENTVNKTLCVKMFLTCFDLT